MPGVTQGDPVLTRNGRTWYPVEVISQAGIPSEKLFLYRNHIDEVVIQWYDKKKPSAKRRLPHRTILKNLIDSALATKSTLYF